VKPFLQWKSNKYCIFLVCVCSLSYPGCKAHAPHYVAIVGCLDVPYFSTLSLKLHDFRKILVVFSLQLVFEAFLTLRRTERDVIINVLTSSCKVPVIRIMF